MQHNYEDLITIFNRCFLEKYNTQLVKGTDEPLYVPADEVNKHSSLYFAHGFFSSALHECSHWLIAGANRRKQLDFGYWYVPDGRNSSEQELFQSMEIKPQAMEWILSTAARYRFGVSLDNINGSEADTKAFKLAVYSQVQHYCEQGLPARAELFRSSLCTFYNTSPLLKIEDFNIATLF